MEAKYLKSGVSLFRNLLKTSFYVITVAMLLALFNNCGQGFKAFHLSSQSSFGQRTPTPTPTATPTSSATPTPTATPRASPTPRPSPILSPTPVPTPLPSQPCQGPNCLRDAAAALAPGQSAAFDITTFGSDWVNGYDLAWNHRLHWDPNRRQLHMQGKRHNSVGNDARYVRYSADTNTWESMSSVGGSLWPLGIQIGHAYDAGTLDTSNGRFYYLPLYSSQIAYFDPTHTFNGQYTNRSGGTSTYSNFHPNWFGAGMNVTPQSNWHTTGPFALAYHPNLFGNGMPGFVVPSPPFGGVTFYDHINDRWSLYRTSLTSDTNGAAVYIPGMDAVVFSYGASNGTMYAVHRNDDVLSIASAPSGGIPGAGTGNNNSARLMDGPNGLAVLLENTTSGPGRIWQYRVSDRSWVNTGVTQRFSELSGNSDKVWISVYIPTYNIYLMVAPRTNTGVEGRPWCYIWKPNF